MCTCISFWWNGVAALHLAIRKLTGWITCVDKADNWVWEMNEGWICTSARIIRLCLIFVLPFKIPNICDKMKNRSLHFCMFVQIVVCHGHLPNLLKTIAWNQGGVWELLKTSSFYPWRNRWENRLSMRENSKKYARAFRGKKKCWFHANLVDSY